MTRSSALVQLVRFAFGMLLAVAATQAVAHPEGRLDPDERQRLRQQMHDERGRMRAERLADAPGGRGWRVGRWSEIAPGTPPLNGPFGPPAEGAPAPGSVAYPAPPVVPQRMSPDERAQLRRQLREARFRQGQ